MALNRFHARFYSNLPEILPYSTVKRIRNPLNEAKEASEPRDPPRQKEKHDEKVIKPVADHARENQFKIQMLSQSLFDQIFKNCDRTQVQLDPVTYKKFANDLSRHGLKMNTSPRFEDIDLKLPKMHGQSIEDHFQYIAEQQCKSYRSLIKTLLTDPPPLPNEWILAPGWTKYDPDKGPILVDFPDEDALVFDIEVCLDAGSGPVLACAVGKCWYSWVSHSLISLNKRLPNHRYSPDELIPLEGEASTTKPRIIVGHNVSYDRARVKEQYSIEQSKLRFLDTMSLHVAVSGVTSYQRAMLKANKEDVLEDSGWSSQTSLNSLSEVYKLYCGKTLSKEARNVFVEGTLNDVLANYQDLVNYCAGDVLATRDVLRQLFPLFLERFPHPATLAGMLEVGMAYLPINSNWLRYINEANLTFQELGIESRHLLAKRAIEAVKLMEDEQYKKDLWMWDQDWSTQTFKTKIIRPTKASRKAAEVTTAQESDEAVEEQTEEERLEKKFQSINSTTALPSRRPYLAGYPLWYRKLCSKPPDNKKPSTTDGSEEEDWSPYPDKISTGMQVTPKLLNLCWEGYPLHFVQGHGWGFLVPFAQTHTDDVVGKIPIEELVKKCPAVDEKTFNPAQPSVQGLWQDVERKLSKKDFYERVKKDNTDGRYKGTGVWSDLALEGCCWFLKLPHKDGPHMKVGNPLAKDFINKFSENVLSAGGADAARVMEIAKMLSYWRNNKDRIEGQLAVWQPFNSAPEYKFGAIIPQLVVCGTLTRRAMEPTWLTASNAKEQRVGSELRAMVQSPPGYKIVGADVDSQELWIASVLGDAFAARNHGATPLGWMTLSGTKADGSDMHSVTAKAIGINRDQAKVINYARIYGAGQQFAVLLLKQFNPTISDGEAKSKAHKMFLMTKGRKLYHLLPEFKGGEFEDRGYTNRDATRISALHGKNVLEMFERAQWEGGTESAMFNRLEQIANEDTPRTPFLESRLSRALEPQHGMEDRYLPTRVNWVVQSGAVDFLNLMLVCMRWLMQDKIRFCLSFHDEVRYLVKEEDAHKAALAMHVTNLLVRAFCSSRLGLVDLPQSVAFFSSVEVDTVLRKEATIDCKTPSNPHGLSKGYGIPIGETLDVKAAIEKAGGGNISAWPWHSSIN